MTTRRTSRSRSRVSRPARRRTEWDTLTSNEGVVPNGGQGTLHLTQGFHDQDGRKGFTLIRIIGNLTVRQVEANVLHEWAAGIAYVSSEAANVAIYPDPATDARFPWIWFNGAHEFESNLTAKRWEVDSKSKRMFREADAQLRLIFDNHSPSGSLAFAFHGRLLYALP